jgi:lysosomal Pro-X carboxypeptidase
MLSVQHFVVLFVAIIAVANGMGPGHAFRRDRGARHVISAQESLSQPSSVNCTWKFVEQPLSHFARASGGTYKERLCIYDSYWTANTGAPVFFYTGNESPLEEYINNTGLIWDLAAEFGALIVFAEHRYFGESIPDIKGMPNCLSYLSSQEALADYASVVNVMKREWGAADSAVIAFGGSYGGMLASWMRMVYPSAVDGAISCSAPIWGFPLDGAKVDGSAQTVTFAASPGGGSAPRCAANLKAAYVVLGDVGKTAEGRALLSETMGLCSPLESERDMATLLTYLQSPLFNLAEGSYPFPTDYITFALTDSTIPLPAWPMRVMCDQLAGDYGVSLAGAPQDVLFSVSATGVDINVDWDQTSNNGYSLDTLAATGALRLVRDVADAVQIWYNLTGEETCVAWKGEEAPNAKAAVDVAEAEVSVSGSAPGDNVCTLDKADFTPGDGWNALTCNEGLNLVNWWVQGVGNDLYWPPNQPRGYTMDEMVQHSLDYCVAFRAQGLYGIPEEKDVYSLWEDTVYGGTRLQYATNIVFTNGNLDPWIPAGVVLEDSGTDNVRRHGRDRFHESVQALVIDQGGHHLDLFFPTEEDPASVRRVREVERAAIRQWIDQAAAK